MWSAIALVSTGFALAAFVGAVAAYVLRTSILEQERLIRTAPASSRENLVRDAMEFFRVNTENLTKEQQYQLALRQIHARAQRFKTIALVVCFVAFVAAAVAALALVQSRTGDPDPCRDELGDARPAECLEKTR